MVRQIYSRILQLNKANSLKTEAPFCTFLLLMVFVGGGGFVFGPCFAMQYLLAFLVMRSSHPEERAGCFTLFVFLLSLTISAVIVLPRGSMG